MVSHLRRQSSRVSGSPWSPASGAMKSSAASKSSRSRARPMARSTAAGPGGGNATLYRHFPTRAKLLEAVYDQRIAELCAAAAELAQPAAPARALHEWLRAVVAHVTDRRVLTDAFLAAYEGPADVEPPQFAAWHDALFEAGRPLLAAAQDAGTARRDLDIAELLALVTGMARAGGRAQAE